MMIDEVCAYIHNYFNEDTATGRKLIYPGTYTITDGNIELPFLYVGQYYRVFGSKMNDGVHVYGEGELQDETFTGVIWEMRPPKSFLDMVTDIEAWVDKYDDVMKNPYQSEDMIGVYRYTKMTTGKVTGDYIATWQNAYKHQLKQWRRLNELT